MALIRFISIYFIFLCLISGTLPAQFTPEHYRKLTALRLTEPIKIDGRLTESVWQRPGERGFIQREPHEGASASEETEVWVAYDNDALYVAAHMYDGKSDSIVGLLARRDADSESDYILVALDAAHDKQTGQYFRVNAAGAIEDGTFFNDTYSDAGWDGIWDVAVCLNDKGWSVEFRIPYSQLRFSKKDEYVWGIEFRRRIQRKNEESFLVLHPRTDAIRVSRWTELQGISGIEPPARIELLPYIAGTGKFLQQPPADAFNAGRTDPFIFGRDYLGKVGADAKIGLSGDVTLDLTLNPDFAQVEVDPAVVNLTAYEIKFAEKRPFFIEGSNIFSFGRGGASTLQDFNWKDPNFFYSRRIGRAPQGSVTHSGFEDIPDRTTILGAAKVSGKFDKTLSIAALTAVTNREYGRVDSAGVRFSDEIEPLTLYGVVRAQKLFNDARQSLGVLATMVSRDLREPQLQNILNDRAMSLGLDGWSFLDQEKVWVVTGWGGASSIRGTNKRLISLQRSAQHYFQRPDVDYIKVDSNATSLTGWASRVWLDKVKGNWLLNIGLGAISPNFEANDVGFLQSTDQINMHIFGGYAWYDPDPIFRTKSVTLAVYRDYNFGGFKTGDTYRLDLSGQFLNYWGLYLGVGHNIETYDDKRTRGGPLMKSLRSDFAYLNLYSDSRENLSGTFYTNASEGVSGGWQFNTGASLHWKVSKTLRMSLGPDFFKTKAVAQYITSRNNPYPNVTYGRRYIFATLDQTILSATFRVNWSFTPTLSFQMYVQPYFSTGIYSGIKELAKPGTFSFNYYGEGNSSISRTDNVYSIDPDGLGESPSFTLSNPDFNYKSLRANAVLRWEYLPGSTLYFVWTNEKVDYVNNGEFSFGSDLRTLLNVQPDNVFSIKITYWLNP